MEEYLDNMMTATITLDLRYWQPSMFDFDKILFTSAVLYHEALFFVLFQLPRGNMPFVKNGEVKKREKVRIANLRHSVFTILCSTSPRTRKSPTLQGKVELCIRSTLSGQPVSK